MRSPDEIKKGLKHCPRCVSCTGCPYDEEEDNEMKCLDTIMDDALAYIQQLEIRLAGACGVCAYNFTGDKSCLAHIKQLESRLAQVERERDAAVRIVHGLCLHCKNEDSKDETCRECMYYPYRVVYGTGDTYVDNWQWRGVCAENTKEE